MRILIPLSIAMTIISAPVFAQHTQPKRVMADNKDDAASEEKAVETRRLIAKGLERQKTADQRNSKLWDRWVYAVCLGCGWAPKNVRIMHTHPSRVLIGIPAADDDAREWGSKRIKI